MKTKWELFGGVDRSLMESLLRDEGEVIKQSPAKSVTRHEIGGESFYVKRSRHSVFPLRPAEILVQGMSRALGVACCRCDAGAWHPGGGAFGVL